MQKDVRRYAIVSVIMMAIMILFAFVCLGNRAHSQPPPPKVIAYYPDWSIWGMKPWMLDFSANGGIDIVIHFSADPDASTSPYFSPVTKASDSLKLQYGTGNNDRSINFQDSLIHYAHKNGKYSILCIGGIYGNSDTQMDQVCSDINKIRVYVKAIGAYCRRKGYDGVDVDWENPNNPTDYINLLTELRNELGQNAIITAAVYSFTNTPYYSGALSTMTQKLNVALVMSYDQGVSPNAGFNSPLKKGECAYKGGTWTAWTRADHDVQNWYNVGFPKDKLAYAFPFYGWEFTGVDGPCQVRTGGQWYRSYANAMSYLAQYPNSKRWDDSSKVPYLSFTDGSGVKHMVSYDDSLSIYHKMLDAKRHSVGYLFIYELNSGWVSTNAAGKRDPLMQAFKANYRKVFGNTTPPPTPLTVTLTSAKLSGVTSDVFSVNTSVSGGTPDSTINYTVMAGGTTKRWSTTTIQTNLNWSFNQSVAGSYKAYAISWKGGTQYLSNQLTFTISIPVITCDTVGLRLQSWSAGYQAGLTNGIAAGIASINKDSIKQACILEGKRLMWDAMPASVPFTPAPVQPPSVSVSTQKPPRP